MAQILTLNPHMPVAIVRIFDRPERSTKRFRRQWLTRKERIQIQMNKGGIRYMRYDD